MSDNKLPPNMNAEVKKYIEAENWQKFYDAKTIELQREAQELRTSISKHIYEQWKSNVDTLKIMNSKEEKQTAKIVAANKCLISGENKILTKSSLVSSTITTKTSEYTYNLDNKTGDMLPCLKGRILPKTLASLLNDNMVISGSDDCTLKVWSTAHRSHFTCINDTKFCPIHLIELLSENLLAVAFQNAEIWVFDINNGNAISKIALDSNFVSVFCKYSSTNVNLKEFENYFAERFLVFGTQSGKLMQGDVLASSATTVLEFHSKITAAIHNCKIVICGTAEGDIGMFDPIKKLLKTVHGAHKGFLGTFCFSEKDKMLHLLSSGNDNVLKLWRVERDDFELTLQNEFLNKHRDAITCALFTPLTDLLTGSYDNNILLWDDGSVKVFEGLQSSVLKIAYSGDYILGCSNDGALVMWHKNGAVLTTIPGIDQSSAVLTFHVAEVDSGEFAVTLAYVDLDGSIKITKPLQDYLISESSQSVDHLASIKKKDSKIFVLQKCFSDQVAALSQVQIECRNISKSYKLKESEYAECKSIINWLTKELSVLKSMSETLNKKKDKLSEEKKKNLLNEFLSLIDKNKRLISSLQLSLKSHLSTLKQLQEEKLALCNSLREKVCEYNTKLTQIKEVQEEIATLSVYNDMS